MIKPSELCLDSLPWVPIDQRSTLPQIPAIYFCLTPLNTVVYIGETSNLRDRWTRYSHNKQRQCQDCGCDRVAWLEPVPQDRFRRLSIEKDLIREHRPVLNMQLWGGLRRHNPGRFYEEVLGVSFDVDFGGDV